MAETKPDQVTLVPDPPEAITSSEGWNTIKYKDTLIDIIQELKSFGIRTSIFTDTNLKMIEGAKDTGTDRIELYTEPYASVFPENPDKAINGFIEAAKLAQELGIGLNAGHDLNLKNLKFFTENIPGLLEVSIGHALISDALYYGLKNTIQMYLHKIK